jgi:hypothetical protein
VSAGRPRALIVAPRFFGYEQDIAREFENQGFEVRLVDERPSNSSWAKALFRVNTASAKPVVDRYFRGLLREGFWEDFSLVLVIRGEVVPPWFIAEVRTRSPKATVAFYSWDSVANSSNFVGILPYIDHLFSFQPDTAKVDARFRLKHLFYAPDFHPLGSGEQRRYEGSFIGTLHSGRHAFVKRALAAFSPTFEYFFFQAKWYYALRRIFDRRVRGVSRSEVRFDKLSRREVAEVFRNSLAVVDMQHENQSGLTMRTFEVLASGAYLITTNPFIRETALIDTGRVLLVDADVDSEELVARLRAEPVPVDAPEGFERFSLRSWVREFVELAEPAP